MTNIKVVVGALIVLIVVSLIAVRFKSQKPPQVDLPALNVSMETTPEEAPATEGQTLPSQAGTLTLTITSPTNGATVTNTSLRVSGKTVPGAEVFINDKEARADALGNFSVTITLDEGENTIIVMANDADGNVAEKELTVTYNSGQ